jgi:hypothetical protein
MSRTGTKGDPRGEFRSASHAVGHQQPCRVGTGDKKDEDRCDPEHQEKRLNGGRLPFTQRDDAQAPVLGSRRVLLPQTGANE